MNYLFELLKDHKTLPKAEILACLKAEKITYKILDSNEDVLVIDTNTKIEKIGILADRLSYVFFVDELLFSCSPFLNDIKKHVLENTIKKDGSIAIRCKNRSKNIDSREIVKILAEIYSNNRKVDLENPDLEIRALITDSKIYVGLKLFEINRNQFEDRKVQFRPFFSPITMHPKLARALVNLSSIKRNDILLDPFCGTGGILLEAGLIGAKVIGSDIEEKMIDGCKKTFDFYKVKNYKLYHSDIGEIGNYIDKVDSIVTDLPYGKSTTTKGEKIILLYKRAFESMSKLLKNGGRAVIGLSNKDLIFLGENYFSIIDKHDFRAHSSLVRYFVIYEK